MFDTQHNVFVFGTLKDGFPNFAVNRGVRIEGDFQTMDRYPLYLVGERHSPWLIDDIGQGKQVKGQLFAVSEEVLADMDRLERISEPDGYRRTRIDVRLIDNPNSSVLSVFVYLKPLTQLNADEIRLGPLHEYELSHASLYRSRPGN